MTYRKRLYPRLNLGTDIISSSLYVDNEIKVGDITSGAVEEPGMIIWDGEHFRGYTGTSGWINLDLTSSAITAPGINGNIIYNNNGSLDGFGTWSANTLTISGSLVLSENSSSLSLLSPNGTTYEISFDNTGYLLVNSERIIRTLYQNDIVFTNRAGLNVLTNGISVLTDDDINNETEFSLKFAACVDVDFSGVQDGDVVTYDSASQKFVTTQVTPDETIIYSIEANISSDDILSTIVPAGYKIDAITVSETSGNDAGNISIGISNGTDEVVSNNTILANADKLLPLGQEYFSRNNDTDLYISSTSWDSGVITVYFTFKKI